MFVCIRCQHRSTKKEKHGSYGKDSVVPEIGKSSVDNNPLSEIQKKVYKND